MKKILFALAVAALAGGCAATSGESKSKADAQPPTKKNWTTNECLHDGKQCDGRPYPAHPTQPGRQVDEGVGSGTGTQ